MADRLLKGIGYAFSLLVVLYLLTCCHVYQLSYLHFGALVHPPQYDAESVFVGLVSSWLLLSLHGVGTLVQVVVRHLSLHQLFRSLNNYLTVFYLLSAGYYLYYFVKTPA